MSKPGYTELPKVMRLFEDAYKLTEKITGVTVYDFEVEAAGYKALRVFLREIVWSAMRKFLRSNASRILSTSDDEVRTCVNEVSWRLVYDVILVKIGVEPSGLPYVAGDIRGARPLRNLPISFWDLSKLYSEVRELMKNDNLVGTIKAVEKYCTLWVTIARKIRKALEEVL